MAQPLVKAAKLLGKVVFQIAQRLRGNPGARNRDVTLIVDDWRTASALGVLLDAADLRRIRRRARPTYDEAGRRQQQPSAPHLHLRLPQRSFGELLQTRYYTQ